MPSLGEWEILNVQADALAMHAALLSTGQVLYFGGNERREDQHKAGPSGWDHTRIWTPSNGIVNYIPSPKSDLFCCGHSFLASGQLLVMGGTEAWFDQAGPIHGPHAHMPGLRSATRFDPYMKQADTAWTGWNPLSDPSNKGKQLIVALHPDGRLHAFMVGIDDRLWHNEQFSLPWLSTSEMLAERGNPAGGGRWYPTALTLSDGRVITMGGHPNSADSRHSNFMVELFDPSLNLWIDAGDEPQSVISAVANRPAHKPEIYPRLHLLPDGNVFCVALADEKSYFWHPTDGFTPLSTTVPSEMYLSRNYDLNLWGSVLLPLRPDEGYVARILVGGGISQPYIITPRASNPMWQPTQPRKGYLGTPPIRSFASLVLLPDGTVLMVGGTQDMKNDHYAVLEAEQYNPVNDTWTKLAAAEVPRQYHSAALLLPDGRVWTGGSNPNDGSVREERMEVFSPPYLFRGPRPTIDSLPTDLAWGADFSIYSQNTADIARVVLIRCGSATHGFDADQRFVELEIQSRSVLQNALIVKAPPNNNIAPPGYYMLFVLNTNDVPSSASMVHL